MRDDKGRFLPGVSGNPSGKPAGRNRKAFAEAFWSRWEAAEAGERMAEEIIKALDKGHLRAAVTGFKVVSEFIEGKPGVRKGEQDETAAELIERFAAQYEQPEQQQNGTYKEEL